MILNCPKCNSPVIKGMDGLDKTGCDFIQEIRCPNCKSDIKAHIFTEVIIEINGELYLRGKKISNFVREVNIRHVN